RRLRGLRAVVAQLVQWQVKPGHSSLRPVRVAESSPTIFLVTADPGARGDNWRGVPGEYGTDGGPAGASPNGASPSGARPGGVPARGRRAAAICVLILGLAGLAVSVSGVAVQLLPRHFTASQQRQIQAWEVIRRWQTMPAGQVFPASIPYQL